MPKKVATIQYGSVKEYATVPARLKEFREACPHGSIETKPTIMDEGVIMFSTTIIKDLSDPHSARATGSSLGKSAGVKAFEKLETISVGRALALLGYGASGEIASSEEMEEFNKFKDEKKVKAINDLKGCKTVDALKEMFLSLGGLIAEPDVIKAKNETYLKLTAPKKTKGAKKPAKVEEGEADEAQLPEDLK